MRNRLFSCHSLTPIPLCCLIMTQAPLDASLMTSEVNTPCCKGLSHCGGDSFDSAIANSEIAKKYCHGLLIFHSSQIDNQFFVNGQINSLITDDANIIPLRNCIINALIGGLNQGFLHLLDWVLMCVCVGLFQWWTASLFHYKGKKAAKLAGGDVFFLPSTELLSVDQCFLLDMGNNNGHAFLLLSDENGTNNVIWLALFWCSTNGDPCRFCDPFVKPFTFFVSLALHTVQKMTNFPVSLSSLCLCDPKICHPICTPLFSVAYYYINTWWYGGFLSCFNGFTICSGWW